MSVLRACSRQGWFGRLASYGVVGLLLVYGVLFVFGADGVGRIGVAGAATTTAGPGPSDTMTPTSTSTVVPTPAPTPTPCLINQAIGGCGSGPAVLTCTAGTWPYPVESGGAGDSYFVHCDWSALDPAHCDGYDSFVGCLPGFHSWFWGTNYDFGWYIHDQMGGILAILEGTPDIAQGLSNGSAGTLSQLYTAMSTVADEIAALLVALTLFQYVLRTMGQTDFIKSFGGAWRAVIGVGLLKELPQMLQWWFAGVNDIAQHVGGSIAVFPWSWLDAHVTDSSAFYWQSTDFDPHPAQYFGSSFALQGPSGTLSNAGGPMMANMDGIWNFLFFLLLVFFIIAVVYALFVRLTGVFVLVALVIVAPLCVATWILPQTSGIAKWWWASFVTYSLWGLGFALTLLTCQAILGTDATQFQTIFFSGAATSGSLSFSGDQVYFFQMALAGCGLLVLTKVPQIMDGIMGGLSSQHTGAGVVGAGVAGAARVVGRV